MQAIEPDSSLDPVEDMEDIENRDDFVTDDGDVLPDEVQAELEALAAVELDEGELLEAALAEAQREIARQRALTQEAVARYRAAVLAAEPDLPEDLVRGETIEEIDAAVTAARDTVARIRERVATERPRGFPVGAPARERVRQTPLTAQEKIAAGLRDRPPS